ncbi:MAG: alpha-mannosidase [Kiritimatiellae bacterium]|nr:alpha-mannosidase [Kiritimatiellia bacterium]
MNDGLRALYEERVAEWIRRVEARMMPDAEPLRVRIRKADPLPSFANRRPASFRTIRIGECWGRDWERAWFHVSGRIPARWRGHEVCARINLGGEALVHDRAGRPFESLSVHTIYPMPEFERARIPVTASARGGERVEWWLTCTAAQLFGLELQNDRQGQPAPVFGTHESRVRECALHTFRRDLWNLRRDAALLNDLMRALPQPGVQRSRLLETLMRAVDAFGDASPKEVRRAQAIVDQALRVPCAPSDLRTTAIGHAHLDTAWLWPVAETREKCARTFAHQLTMLDRYPGYVFGASQAQHYAWIRESHPALFERIRQAVRSGRWELLGGMWVEPDCQVSGGEALVRQILHGQRFFREAFGRECRTVWLPDVFGFNAALPQIFRRAGLEYFVSIKIAWNQFNRFPHHTFRWRGIDGSEVVAHFPPEGDYNSLLKPSRLRAAQERYAEHPDADEFLTIFGIGDGGGGPSEDHIETGRRLRGTEGCPAVRFGRAQDVMERIAGNSGALPVWSGELYLEKHRGTLTTQARTKRMNRAMELRLRETEWLWSSLPLKRYPSSALDLLWEKLLLNQFHDILPGSSIPPVYEDAQRDYSEIDRETRRLQDEAVRRRLPAQRGSLALLNSLSNDAVTAIPLPESWRGYEALNSDGHPVPAQAETSHPVALVNVPALGAITLRRGRRIADRPDAAAPAPRKTRRSWTLENDLIRYTFGPDGRLMTAYDLVERRDALAAPGGNRLELFEDFPAQWDAWDIDPYYTRVRKDRARLISARPCAAGPVRQGLELNFQIGQSTIVQQVYLNAGSRRLDFHTQVEWRENHKLLRVAFSTTVTADAASFEIPFGRVSRPTHANTSWDWARFECAAHRYADVSGPEYGVALLNNGKYGHSALGGELGLSLLRAPTMPAPMADRGTHEFIYSLLPHPGPLESSDVLAEAALLNQPPMRFEGRNANGFAHPVRLQTAEGIVLEAVKKSVDGRSWVARLYEPMGRHARGSLLVGIPVSRVQETDLMEKPLRAIQLRGHRVPLQLKPYEIRTIRITPRG